MENTIRSVISVLIVINLVAGCNNDSTTTTTDSKAVDTSTPSSSNTASSENPSTSHNMDGMMKSMNSMMSRMKAMKMTGDFDIDFANMMIEHHQGAIDMSEHEVSNGKDEKMKGMAQKIITAQKEEITQLQDFLKTYKPSGMKHGEGELEKSMSDMESKMKSMPMSSDIDKDFAMMMKDHHAGAVAMSKKELTNGMSAKLKQMAQKTITDQNKEIKEFDNWLQSRQ